MNILITGGAGFLGHEIAYLLNKVTKNKIFIVDNLTYEFDYLYPYQFQFGDVSDELFMKKLLKTNNFDIVIHLAAIVGDEACRIHNKKAYNTNIKAIKILLDNFEGKIIFPSSCSVYGSNNKTVVEESILNPLSFYAQTKVEAETLLKNTNSIIYRLGTLHGITNRFRNDLVINTLTLKALLNNKIFIFGGNQWRPVIHVKDVAETIATNLTSNKTGIYNLLTENYTIAEIGNIIKEHIPKVEIVFTKIPFEDERNYKASNQKIKQELLLISKYTILNTIQQIKKIHHEGRIKNYSNIKYSNIGRLEYKI